MKVGAENRRQVMLLVALLVLALVSVARMLFTWGRSPEASAPPEPVAASPAPAAPRPAVIVRGRRPGQQNPVALASNGDPRLKLDLLKYSEDMKYEGTGRNIFQAKMEEIPKIITPPDKPKFEAPQPPPGPPPPPPINLKFFGFANRPGEAKKIFLSQDGDVFIAGEGDIVDRRYKVVRIQANSVEVEDVLNNRRQTLPLTPTS